MINVISHLVATNTHTVAAYFSLPTKVQLSGPGTHLMDRQLLVLLMSCLGGSADSINMQVCEDLKIQSQNDTAKLEEAKGMVYLKGFNEGVMTVGRYSGDRVADAKPKMRQDLLDSGDGIKYAEPEGRVVSRSGDECIVALTDQW